MRTTNIKTGIALKRKQGLVFFRECPVCKCFYGTDQPEVKTGSVKCDKVFDDVKAECISAPVGALGYL